VDLRELDVVRLPGLDERFTIAARPGVNLVLGPNGSGKSSLCRAALGLLWSDPAGRGVLRATWQDGETTWHASRDGGPRVAWQRDGQPAAPPAAIPTGLAGAFRLGILDLLKPAADQTDADLARAVRNQLAGGYDVASLLAAATVSRREGQKAREAYQHADRQVRELKEARQRLREEEAQLGRLEVQLAAAREAARRAAALALAERVQQSRAAAGDAAARLRDRYPAAMARLEPTTLERLEALRSRQSRARQEADEASQDLAAAEADLLACGLPDGGPPPDVLARVRQRLDRARAMALERDRAAADLAAAAGSLQAAAEHLAFWGPPPDAGPVDPATLRSEVAAAQARLERGATHSALDRLLARPDLAEGPRSPGADPDSLAAARGALVDWLAAASERASAWPLLLAGGLLLAAGLWLRPWQAGTDGWALIAGGAGVLALALWRRLRRPRTSRAVAAFQASGQPGPARWRTEDVAGRLTDLAAAEAASRLDLLRTDLRRSLQAELGRVSADLAASGRADQDPALAADLAERLHRNAAYHQARRDHAAGAERLAQLDRDLDRGLAAAADELATWLRGPAMPAHGPSPDPVPLAAAVDDLAGRAETHRDARRRAAEARRRLEDRQRLAAEAEAEATQLLADLGLGPSDDPQVRALSVRLTSYQADRTAAHRTATEAEVAAADLARLPADQREVATAALRADPAALAAELAAARGQAAQLETLQAEVVRIETRREAAFSDASLDEALARRDAAAAALAAVRDEVRATSLRRVLLEHVRREHRRAAEPPVLLRARKLLRRFTGGRWDLVVADEDDETFRAVDRESGRGHALSELSDGTRAQLLLAARLAFLQEAERGQRLPLFLDESLTASDSVRFAAVAGAIAAMVRDEQRQVFYLTCDPADIGAWQDALTAAGLGPAPVIDLAAVRRLAAAAPPDRLRPGTPGTVPAPRAGEDPAAYAGRLGVPPLAPHGPASAAHLFHLLHDDLPQLHALLSRGVVRLGQVGAVADVLAADGALAPLAARRLAARGRALEAFLGAFAIGRGRPLHPGAILYESGVRTSKLEEIEDLASACGGDARRLVAALEAGEVARLQREKRDELELWLEQQGYLDRREVQSRDEVQRDVIRAVRGDVQEGRLDLTVVPTLVASWWTAAGGEVGPGDDRDEVGNGDGRAGDDNAGDGAKGEPI